MGSRQHQSKCALLEVPNKYALLCRCFDWCNYFVCSYIDREYPRGTSAPPSLNRWLDFELRGMQSINNKLKSHRFCVVCCACLRFLSCCPQVLQNEAYRDSVLARTPMGRIGAVEEVSAAIAFLCMDASSYVTGQIIGVDGGFMRNGFWWRARCERVRVHVLVWAE